MISYMKSIRFLSSAAVVILCTVQALAWDNVGHTTITCIAQRHLTPEAKARCESYLKHTIPFHASWMDYWRNSKAYRVTSHWHGVPIGADMECVPGDTESAAVQVMEAWKALENFSTMTDSLVELNIKYLLHMVGDMHCPCHTKYLDNDDLKWPMVYRKGKRTSTHNIWDSSIGMSHPRKYADAIAASIDVYSNDEIAELCKGTPYEWAHQNAIEMQPALHLFETDENVDDRTDEQKKVMRIIADRQAAKAGYRLAYILNSIFGLK